MNTESPRSILAAQRTGPPLPNVVEPSAATASTVQPAAFPQDTQGLVVKGGPINPPLRFRVLRCGCYLVNYQPNGNPLVSYDGPLRVECHGEGRTASGDLYQRPVFFLPFLPRRPPRPFLLAGPDPAAGIPTLARDKYRFYLRVTEILEYLTIGNSFTLRFEMYRFDKASGAWSSGGNWTYSGDFTAVMNWQAAPPAYPSSGDYLAGDVKDARGTIVGRLTMGWVSEFLRKATIEIDRVSASEAPLKNSSSLDWEAIGRQIDWDITVAESNSKVVEPSGASWNDGECHAAMLSRRDSSDLDGEWRYHVLCVRAHDTEPRGIMYDSGGADSNNVPREGCVIASHWTIPDSPEWGRVRGMRFGTAADPYFRTAAHEIGHAMGLVHNYADNGFMSTTDVISEKSLTPGSRAFPRNIQWSYNAEDAKRLRHLPDIYIRPGGLPFAGAYSVPISPTDLLVVASELELRVTPIVEAVPLGAPVRVDIELANTAEQAVVVPSKLSLKSGSVRGQVIDPAGIVHDFSPLMVCVDDNACSTLQPGQTVCNSLTLLRGSQGALFPMPGAYRIRVEAHWMREGVPMLASGEACVMVTSTVDDAHARAALKVLGTPDTLLALVFGGDHLAEGIDAIRTALNNQVLRPHFAYIEAKRVATRFGQRPADLKAAAGLIDDATVMSPAEIRKAARLIKAEESYSPVRRDIARNLKNKVAATKASDDIRELVDAL